MAIALTIASSLVLSFSRLPQRNSQKTHFQNAQIQMIASAAANERRPPAPPNTPPPNGTRPGGGLNPDETSHSILKDGLRALIPIENPVLTASAYPTFLFYVPEGSDAVQYGEFSLLLWPNEEIRHYTTRFQLPESRGIVSITIPEISAYALTEGQPYRWYFQLFDNVEETTPEFTLHGSVQRVPLTSERAQQIQAGSPEIWYDALSNVAEQLQHSPQDGQLQAQWQRLLVLIEAEEIGEAPFAGSILFLED